jgi:WD40 repeat protein
MQGHVAKSVPGHREAARVLIVRGKKQMPHANITFKHHSHCQLIAITALYLLLFQSSVITWSQQTQDGKTLQPSTSVEHTLRGEEAHSYLIKVEANQFLRITVEQRGIDVVVSLYSPDGKLLEERDRPNSTRGEESLSAEVTVAGLYRVEVKAWDTKTDEGTYEISLETPRVVTAQDEKRITAEKTFQEAVKLQARNTSESLIQAAQKYAESVVLWNELQDSYAEGLAFNTLFSIYQVLRQGDQAIEAANKALAIHRSRKDRKSEGEILFQLGELLKTKGQYEQAAQYYEESARARHDAEDTKGENEAYMSAAGRLVVLSAVQSRYGEGMKTLGIYGRALALFQKAGDKSGEADTLNLIGNIYYFQGDKTKALKEYRQAFNLFQEAKDKEGIARAERSINLIIPKSPSQAELIVQTGHLGPVTSIALSPNKKILASGSYDNTIKLWDVETGKELRTLTRQFRPGITGASTNIYSVSFTPDGKTLASGSSSSVMLWDVESGKELRTIGDSSGPVSLSPDGKTLANEGLNAIKLWDVESGKELRTLTGHRLISSVAFSVDGKLLASGSWDKTIKLWDVESGKELRTLTGHSESIMSVSFGSDGKTLASGSHDKTIKLWDVESGKELRTLTGHSDLVGPVSFSPSGKIIASGSSDKTIKLWDVTSGRELRTLIGHTSNILSISFTSDGKTLASGGGDKAVKLWDVTSGRELRTLIGHSDLVGSVSFSPSGRIIASGSSDKTIKLWDVESGKELRTLTGHSESIMSVLFSPSGRIIASGSSDKTIKLWDVESGKELRTLDNSYAVASLSFSPNGKTLASGDLNNLIKLWDVESGIKLWDMESGKKLRTFTGHIVHVWSLLFSPNGKILVSGGSDNTIKLWDVESGKELRTLTGHSNWVMSLSFSSDGKTLASGSFDGQVKIWDIPTGKELCSLITSDEGEWVVIDKEGHFDASPEAQKMMHFVVSVEPIDLEQLKDRYYEPGLLAKIMKRQSLRTVTPFTGDELYPSVECEPVKQDQKSLIVHLRNRGGGIGPVQVFINGKEVVADARPKNFDSKLQETTLNIDLSKAPFIEGEKNSVKVIARNKAGWLRSRGSESFYKAEGEKRTNPPELYAIIGGVSDYAVDKLDLKYAAKDAEDFAHALEIGAIKVFGKDNVHIRLLSSGAERKRLILRGEDSKQLTPIKENFKQVFTEFRKAKSTDIIVIYLSGHGTSINKGGDTGDTYLYLTQEAVTTNSTRLLDEKLRGATTISSDELVQWIKEVHTEKRAMILDTCAAGAAANSFIAKRDITDEQTYQIRALDRLKWLAGFYVLMGSAPNAQSYEATRYGQGLLTYSLLEAMKGGGLQNEYAFVGQVFDYAVNRVPNMAKGNALIQEPRIFTPEQSQDFFVGRFTENEQKLFKLAKEKPLFLRPMFLNKDTGIDDLGFTPLLKISLDNANFVTLGGYDETQLVFVDADEMYDAITPSGQYEILGNNVQLTVNLVRNGKVESKVTVTGKSDDKNALAQQAVKALIQAAQNLK